MKVREIIEDADLLIPNALSSTQKLRYLNHVQDQLYRDFPAPLQSAQLQTEPGASLYDISVQPDRVKNVYIDGQEYTYSTSEDRNVGYLYSFMNNELFIQPTPDSVQEGYILFEGEPAPLINLEDEPPFLPDYHELFVLGLAQRLAMVERDYKTAGELEARYRSIAIDASMNMRKGNLRKIRIVRGWS